MSKEEMRQKLKAVYKDRVLQLKYLKIEIEYMSKEEIMNYLDIRIASARNLLKNIKKKQHGNTADNT